MRTNDVFAIQTSFGGDTIMFERQRICYGVDDETQCKHVKGRNEREIVCVLVAKQ